jgi:hypothetical protein
MSINKTINVSISRKSSTGVINPTNPVTLKSVPTINSGVDRLDALKDVSPSGETSGAVPVYDSVTDKYIVQKLNMTDIVGDLDGGTF